MGVIGVLLMGVIGCVVDGCGRVGCHVVTMRWGSSSIPSPYHQSLHRKPPTTSIQRFSTPFAANWIQNAPLIGLLA